MEEKREKWRGGGALAFAAFSLLVALVILYVLSVGPATWLYCHSYLSGKTFDIFFAPLDWACNNCNPLFEFCDWYKSLFVPNSSLPTF